MNFSDVVHGELRAAKHAKIANRELLAANYANDANCDGAVSMLPFAAAKFVRCSCFFKKKGDGHRPRRDAVRRAAEQIRVIRVIRGQKFKQFTQVPQHSRLRSLAPFPE